MTVEKMLADIDFSQFSKVKDSLLLKLKLRRQAIREEMSLEELDEVAAAGTPVNKKIPNDFDKPPGLKL